MSRQFNKTILKKYKYLLLFTLKFILIFSINSCGNRYNEFATKKKKKSKRCSFFGKIFKIIKFISNNPEYSPSPFSIDEPNFIFNENLSLEQLRILYIHAGINSENKENENILKYILESSRESTSITVENQKKKANSSLESQYESKQPKNKSNCKLI